MTAGEKLNDWLARNRFTKLLAAKELGVDPSTLHKWISGTMPVSNHSRAAIEMFTEKHGEKLPRDIWGK